MDKVKFLMSDTSAEVTAAADLNNSSGRRKNRRPLG